jgi:uncharacterized protein (DUF1015 family)
LITITPVPRALVPVDSEAAAHISAPNYDEFQGDGEIWNLLQTNPMSVLRVTMAHCDAPSIADIESGDTETSLARAKGNMQELIASPLTREVRDVLWVYEIRDPRRPDQPQIGLGGMASTAQIRTEATPEGTIIRNEGIREPKSRGRADLIEATNVIIGTVNNAVDDSSGAIQAALESHADSTAADFEVTDHHGNRHRAWIVEDAEAIAHFRQLFSEEPQAYVADGNHRSAAAAMLGYETFLAVFFPAAAMGIYPYNRLITNRGDPVDGLSAAVAKNFEIVGSLESAAYQPTTTHSIGLYSPEQGWMHLRPLPGTYDPDNAVEAIDADIVQRKLFADVFGIEDAGDPRLTFVGSNKDATWLQAAVDEGRAAYAVTLPAVTMSQFIAVCTQNRHMPPKSTWFEPKIRSGLVMALL